MWGRKCVTEGDRARMGASIYPSNNKPQLQLATPPHPRETHFVLLAGIYVNLLDAQRGEGLVLGYSLPAC